MREKLIVGYSDYSRLQIIDQVRTMDWSGWGDSPVAILEELERLEKEGYTVIFKTSILIKIFCTAKYKIIAVK